MPLSTTRTVSESGFEVTVPRATSFRLADMEPYKKLSGCHLKEMDVGWVDTANGQITLLELKGKEIWDAFDRDRTAAHKHLVENLGSKATDVLLILSSAWSRSAVGVELAKLLPSGSTQYPGEKKLKLCFLVETPASRAPLMGPVKDELNRMLSGRLQLFGIKRVTLMDFNNAKSMGLPVTRA